MAAGIEQRLEFAKGLTRREASGWTSSPTLRISATVRPAFSCLKLLEAHAREFTFPKVGTSACHDQGGNSQRMVIRALLEKRRIDAFAIGMRSLAA